MVIAAEPIATTDVHWFVRCGVHVTIMAPSVSIQRSKVTIYISRAISVEIELEKKGAGGKT